MRTGWESYCISIEEEANARDQDDNPLERLAVDGLVDLASANMAVLFCQFIL